MKDADNEVVPNEARILPRNRTRQVDVGGVRIGGGAPVVVQSMLTAPTADPKAAIAQANGLVGAGCELVRAAIPNSSALEGFAALCRLTGMTDGGGGARS